MVLDDIEYSIDKNFKDSQNKKFREKYMSSEDTYETSEDNYETSETEEESLDNEQETLESEDESYDCESEYSEAEQEALEAEYYGQLEGYTEEFKALSRYQRDRELHKFYLTMFNNIKLEVKSRSKDESEEVRAQAKAEFERVEKENNELGRKIWGDRYDESIPGGRAVSFEEFLEMKQEQQVK
jgi:hypothetical protein